MRIDRENNEIGQSIIVYNFDSSSAWKWKKLFTINYSNSEFVKDFLIFSLSGLDVFVEVLRFDFVFQEGLEASIIFDLEKEELPLAARFISYYFVILVDSLKVRLNFFIQFPITIV